MKEINVVFADVMGSLADVNENNEVMNLAEVVNGLTELIDLLRAKKSELKEQNKAEIKAANEATKAEAEKLGKMYYDSLAIGASFKYRDSKGNIYSVTKIETKSKSDKSAACEVSKSKMEEMGWKRAQKYPKFNQVIVEDVF